MFVFVNEVRERKKDSGGLFVASGRRRLGRKSIDGQSRSLTTQTQSTLVSLTCVVRIHDESVSGLVLSVMSSPAGADIGMRGLDERSEAGNR